MSRPAKKIRVVPDRLSSGSSDEEYLSLLGTRVRAARDARDLSRKQLAEYAEVSERYLAQLETGAGNASVLVLRRVASALRLPMAELIANERSAERRVLDRLLDSLPERTLGEALLRLQREFGAEESVRRKRIALIGLRGAGKSTLGAALAKQMRRPFIELDREIEHEAGMGLSEIFMLYGPAGYRGFERRCLERIIDTQNDMVVSVGGGVVSEADTFQLLLANSFTVWLRASPAEHMSRVMAQGDMRPMKGHAQAMDDLRNLLTSREPLYARADATINTSGQTVEKSLAALRRAINI
jgi:XRE family aerobic/anaerobic benzoate catabolism transcriptional regulator